MKNPTSTPTDSARILIVDDHPNTASMLARVLTKFDTPVEVMTACSGEEALQLVGDGVMDILITDFMMPGINGLELIEKLKGDRQPAHIILITAYDTPGLAITARRLGVQDYLVKPVQPDKICGIVARVLEQIRPARALPQPVSQENPFKILIADDYPDNLRLLSVRLESEGYTFISASDGEETLAKLRSEHPDLVLLDVNMPNKDGFEVLAEMRADSAIAHIPVIMVTAARIGPKDVREGLMLGADDYVTKPFDWREVAARIRSKLRVKQAEDALRRRNRELGVLPEIGQDLSARLNVQDLAQVILNRSLETLQAQTARLAIFYPDGSVFYCDRQAGALAPEVSSETSRTILARDLNAHILATRQGALVQDTEHDPNWRLVPYDLARSAMAVPLLGHEDVLGVLTLTHERPAFFSTDQLTLLQAIASQAAIAVENAQLIDVERKRVQELVALNQFAHEINRFSHSSDLLARLPGLVHETLHYPAVSLWVVQGENGDSNLCLHALAGEAAQTVHAVLALAPQQVASTCRPALVTGSVHQASQAAGSGEAVDTEAQSAVAVPLLRNNRIVGVLAIHSGHINAFQESHRVVLETLASQVVSAWERIELFESVEQEQRRLLAVLRSAAEAILVLDVDHRLTLANPAGEGLFADVEARLGQPLPSGEGYDNLLDLLNLGASSSASTTGEITWPDGRTFAASITPIEDGGQVAVLHDVSHFKALDQLKNEFIATASHDLKNPIMAVLGYNDLLEKSGPLSPVQLDFVARTRHAALQMQELVLNLLEIARMEMRSSLRLEALDLNTVLADVCDEFRPQAQAKDQLLQFTPLVEAVWVNADLLRLQQVVRNLVGNAIKYTPNSGHVQVSLQPVDGHIWAAVEDDGIGIPEVDLPYVFNKFYRVYSDATKDIDGNGLGLAIVKSIIENHGGQVAVESTPGKGSTFRFSLPMASGPAPLTLTDRL